MPTSRRTRPAKPALTREGVIEAALEILRTEGLAKVTMRRVAAALDTGHASLYVYVADTEDLHAQLLDAQLAAVAVPDTGGWRHRLKGILTRYRDVLFAHPELARMALSTQPSGPHYAALVDAVLTLLEDGGVTGQTAAWAVDLLLLYPTSVAVEQTSQGRDKAARFAARRDAIGALDPHRYPRITGLGDLLFAGTGVDRSDWALDVLIDGVLSAATRPHPQEQT